MSSNVFIASFNSKVLRQRVQIACYRNSSRSGRRLTAAIERSYKISNVITKAVSIAIYEYNLKRYVFAIISKVYLFFPLLCVTNTSRFTYPDLGYERARGKKLNRTLRCIALSLNPPTPPCREIFG